MIIFVILALLALLVLALIVKNSKGERATIKPQENNTEQSLVREDGTDEKISDTREGVFRKNGSAKQKTTNSGAKGGSETLEIIKPEENQNDGDDAEQNQGYTMLPGVW